VGHGHNPYINATIIMQLMTVISERHQGDPEGRRAGTARIRGGADADVFLGAGSWRRVHSSVQNTNRRFSQRSIGSSGCRSCSSSPPHRDAPCGSVSSSPSTASHGVSLISSPDHGRGRRVSGCVLGALDGGLAEYLPFIIFGAIALVMTA